MNKKNTTSPSHSGLLNLITLIISCTTISTSTTAATTRGSVKLGTSLFASNPNQTWSSPSNTFALGFIQVALTAKFQAAIFYTGGAPVVWTIRSDPVDIGGALHFRDNGTLQLVNGSGFTLWDSKTGGLGVTSGFLNDTGSFMLQNETGSVWSSFDHPTDTIVPDQAFEVGWTMTSGVYSFRVLEVGNLTLTWNDRVVYWNKRFRRSDGSGSGSNSSVYSLRLVLQSNGILSLFESETESGNGVIVAYSNDVGEGISDVLRFLRLDSDGNLRMYSANKESGLISLVWTAIADQCQVYGYCGNMGICRYNETDPICECPSENFVAVDASDRRKGCKRKVEIKDCPANATLLELEHTKFATFETQQIFLVGITACKLNCLGSVSCVAASSLSDGSGSCYMKNPDFVSGYSSPSLLGTSYVKVCGPVMPNPSLSARADKGCDRWRLQVWMVGVGVLTILFCFFTTLTALWWFWCYKNSASYGGMRGQYALLEFASGTPAQFSYRELHRSTKGFKEKLGEGGFGAVYRGVLSNRMVVAVKQLEGIEQGEKQFRMEVATISSTHHLNLVRLIGFCIEGRHRLLVYEFMKNGSLDKYIFTTESYQPVKLLTWDQRFSIALATARGITYLHEECHDCIVHCDIKPENILLDENFNAKVSDFGLAKLLNPRDPRHRSMTIVRGTRGYLAPEWLANLPITSKSDVYSYGMVLLEILSGKRNFEVSAETNHMKFSSWAYDQLENGNVEAIIDKSLNDQSVDVEQVRRAVRVSFWCIQEHPSQRPTMGKVVQMLEGIFEVPNPPMPKGVTHAVSIAETNMTDLNSRESVRSVFETSAPPWSTSSSLLQQSY